MFSFHTEEYKQKSPPGKFRKKYIKLNKDWAESFDFKVNVWTPTPESDKLDQPKELNIYKLLFFCSLFINVFYLIIILFLV